MTDCKNCIYGDRLSDNEVYCDIFGRTSCFPEHQTTGDGLARYHSETCIYFKPFNTEKENEE